MPERKMIGWSQDACCRVILIRDGSWSCHRRVAMGGRLFLRTNPIGQLKMYKNGNE